VSKHIDPHYDHELVKHDPKEGYDATEPEASRITMFVIVSVVTLVVVIVALQNYFEGVWTSAVTEKILTVAPPELKDQRALEAWRMTHYEYTTPEKKEVRIPLEKSREMVLQDAAQGKTFYPAKPTMPKPEAPPEVKGDSKEAAKEVAKK
jgi:hypothetical protein